MQFFGNKLKSTFLKDAFKAITLLYKMLWMGQFNRYIYFARIMISKVDIIVQNFKKSRNWGMGGIIISLHLTKENH